MDIKDAYIRFAKYIPRPVVEKISSFARNLPFVREIIRKEHESLRRDLEEMFDPYKGKYPCFREIPEQGLPRERIIELMEEFRAIEEPRWKDGFASGTVYHGEDDHVEFLSRVYTINSQSNPLHPDLWPSSVKFEREIVSMTAELLGARRVRGKGEEVCGSVTSGGTESIFLAMKAYRDYYFSQKRLKRPEVLVPESAHAAFEKAGDCLGIKIRKFPLGPDFKADPRAAEKALTRNTIALVGSAPSFPHGVIDPIPELSEIARKAGASFHTDACLGGFLLPFAEELGYEVTPFDFRLKGVTSISADTHKFGYAPKGTSVILYRHRELRHHQYFKFSDWQGGIYCTPTLPGSRPGGLIAASWATLVSMGKSGYLESTRKILQTAAKIREGVSSISELELLGDSLWVITFGSSTVDIYEVMEIMTSRGWSLNALQNPPALHLCVTLRHTRGGVAERFIDDLNKSVKEAKMSPGTRRGQAAMYGIASTFPDRHLVRDALNVYLDTLLGP